MMDFAWMGWTPFTATFFVVIASLLAAMTLWEIASPGGAPRKGVLGLNTTRGDRLFVSLLGSGFIHLGWLFFGGTDLWWALGVSIFYALAVFRWV
jgi:predicted small integral membrane protein